MIIFKQGFKRRSIYKMNYRCQLSAKVTLPGIGLNKEIGQGMEVAPEMCFLRYWEQQGVGLGELEDL